MNIFNFFRKPKTEPVVYINYDDKINQDINIIKSEYDKACLNVYNHIKAEIANCDIDYDWAKDLFKISQTPSFKSIYKDTDLFQIEMNLIAEYETKVIFESELAKELNKSEILRSLNYDFSSEDYPDIFIDLIPKPGVKIIY